MNRTAAEIIVWTALLFLRSLAAWVIWNGAIIRSLNLPAISYWQMISLIMLVHLVSKVGWGTKEDET